MRGHPLGRELQRDQLESRIRNPLRSRKRARDLPQTVIFGCDRGITPGQLQLLRPVSIAVLIGTYGEQKWASLALKRAYPSAAAQLAFSDVVQHHHDPNGDVARECGISSPKASMTTGFASSTPTTSSRRATYRRCGARSRPPRSSIRRRSSRRKSSTSIRAARDPPKVWPVQDLRLGNWLIIGTLVPGRFTFLEVRRLRQAWHGYEDWELWLKIDKLGCRVRKVHDVTYIAHVDPKSRNRDASKRERVFWHYEIGREHYPDIYDDAWLARHLGNTGRRG